MQSNLNLAKFNNRVAELDLTYEEMRDLNSYFIGAISQHISTSVWDKALLDATTCITVSRSGKNVHETHL
jgi:hypothetical protein